MNRFPSYCEVSQILKKFILCDLLVLDHVVFTVPGLLEAAVSWYTHQGLRVLAVAGKALKGHTWNEVFIFGVIVFSVICQLHS